MHELCPLTFWYREGAHGVGARAPAKVYVPGGVWYCMGVVDDTFV